MGLFGDHIQFCYPWRKYQARILNELNEHLKNKHLHLVAPPGSGKTVLGLEVMLRLNEATIIVAPTLAIRNQWMSRFMELFLHVNEQPDWLSLDIYRPGKLTITTYQSLHSFLKEQPSPEGAEDKEAEESLEKNTVLKALDSIEFGTIILDEAHHLRTSWWKSVMQFRNRLHHPNVIALTATPPYDVDHTEWEKYIQLCGPIDAEIYVPELVKEGDLCPHQDYIYASMPSAEEAKPMLDYRDAMQHFQEEIIKHQSFRHVLETHPWVAVPSEYVEEILSNPAYFSSMLIFLHAVGSKEWKKGMSVIGGQEKELPKLTSEWLEGLLNGLFYQDDYVDVKASPLSEFYSYLSRNGAIERRKVRLRTNRNIQRTLMNSVSKLDSIEHIVSFEAEEMGDALRQVILADYIYLPDLPKHSTDEKPLKRLGVIPVFETIRRRMEHPIKVAVLTGSLVILPKSSLKSLEEKASSQGLTITSDVLAHDESYVRIKLTAATRQRMVGLMTAVFQQGDIQVIVGTTSLLGEGWDAPSINSLIIASYVGSFMLSNQMRGRAIRTEKGNETKTATIWHLVCIDPDAVEGGHDFQALMRRFTSLMGLDLYHSKIQTGIERMHLAQPPASLEHITSQNNDMFVLARNRKVLYDRWQQAVAEADGNIKQEEMLLDKEKVPKPFMYKHTLTSLGIVILSIFCEMFDRVMRYPSSAATTPYQLRLVFAIVIGLVIASPFIYKAIRVFLKHSTLEKSMGQVGTAVYQTLFNIGFIKTEPAQNNILVLEERGNVICSIQEGNTYEHKLFVRSLQEVVDPIENPRYLLVRKSRRFLVKRYDYHAVPEEIGRKKEYAEDFLYQWKKYVDKATLVYTRTSEGRKILLRARIKALSAVFQNKSERISVWK